MPTTGPIIIVEDDLDDQEILKKVFQEINLPNEIRFFDSCLFVFDYLMKAIKKPLLILCDINLPKMTGIELKQKIDATEELRRKNIPFVFLTTNSDQKIINEVFRMNVQGYFVKPSTLQ